MPFFQPEHDACKIYSAKFGKGTLDGYIVAGGSGLQPCVKLYHEVRRGGFRGRLVGGRAGEIEGGRGGEMEHGKNGIED
jgi:hypothetical protein